MQNVTYSQESLTLTYSSVAYTVNGTATSGIAPTTGYFRLSISGVGTTGDIYFDPANPGGAAASIQSALRSLTGDSGLTVTDTSNTTTSFTFQVVFSSSANVTDRPAIQFNSAGSGYTTVPMTLRAKLTNPNDTTLGLALQTEKDTTGTLSGEANGAMFSQFDADPSLQSTILTSDDVANANRDGQDATYYIDIDPSAVSGSFSLDVTIYDTLNHKITDTATITPVYLPNNGGIDATKTTSAIQAALKSLPNVGINWTTWLHPDNPTAETGPVDVLLVNNPTGAVGDFAQILGSDWDSDRARPQRPGPHLSDHLPGRAPRHAGHPGSPPTATPCAHATTATQQVLHFSTTTGYFSLSLVADQPTADISIGGLSTTNAAAALQTALAGLVGSSAVTVTAMQGSSTDFLVNFAVAEPTLMPGPPTGANLTAMKTLPTVVSAPSSPASHVVQELAGYAGTEQTDTSIAMTSSGSFVETWMEQPQTTAGYYSNPNIYFRTFQESTDTAGPLVTDFIDPTTGDHIQNGDTVTDQMYCLVVTFDSAMMASGTNSVTNPDNWSLLLNGSVLSDGISAIYYGMNEAADNPLFADLDAPATNKWQAVIVFNGQDAGSYLQDGNYQLVATTALRDAAGNALGETGFQPNGVQFSRSFNVVLPTGSETLVNTGITTGNQLTTAPNSQATASDANGDYVVAWSSATGQNLSFTLTNPTAGGSFRLGFTGPNGAQSTSDVYFDPNNLPQTAANIQAALSTIEAGTTVAYDAVDSSVSGGKFVFNVAFAASSPVLNRPLITKLRAEQWRGLAAFGNDECGGEHQRRRLCHAVRRQLECDRGRHQRTHGEPDGERGNSRFRRNRHENGRHEHVD